MVDTYLKIGIRSKTRIVYGTKSRGAPSHALRWSRKHVRRFAKYVVLILVCVLSSERVFIFVLKSTMN